MMNFLRRQAVALLTRLIGEEPPADCAAVSTAAEPQPQSSPDAAPAPEEAVPETAPSEETPPSGEPETPPDDSACLTVFVSNRAYSAIVAETLSRHPNETGGAFLGHQKGRSYYVVEATDPGLKTQHSLHGHEMDADYMNHLFRHLIRMYRKGLALLGLWHRHPGSFDRFSITDMETIADYAKAVGGGVISMLVNLDPDIRLSCYYCQLQPDGSVRSVQVPVLVGDHYFEGTDFLTTIYPDERIRPVTDRSPIYTEKAA